MIVFVDVYLDSDPSSFIDHERTPYTVQHESDVTHSDHSIDPCTPFESGTDTLSVSSGYIV